MPVLITNKRATFGQLVDQLLTSRASRAQRATATRALEQANPHLSGAIAKGTPVLLPELPKQRVKIDVGTLAGAGRLDEVAAVLAPLPSAVSERSSLVADRSARVGDDLDLLRQTVTDAQLKRFLTKGRTGAAQRAATADAERSAALAKAFSDAAPRWREQLEKLEKQLLRVG
jgi:hypothetical protein